MHWDLLKKYFIPWEAAFLLEYIIEVYPTLEINREIDGITYWELSNDYINKYTQFGGADTIAKYLKILEGNGFIKIVHLDKNGNPNKKGRRFIYLDTKVVTMEDTKVDTKVDTKKSEQKKLKKLKETEDIDQSKIDSVNEEVGYSLTSKGFKPINKWIDTLNLPEDIKNSCREWFKSVGIGIVSVDTFNKKLQKIYQEVNGDYPLMKQSIDNATVNGWKAFYPPKTYNKQTYNIQSSVKASSISQEELNKNLTGKSY